MRKPRDRYLRTRYIAASLVCVIVACVLLLIFLVLVKKEEPPVAQKYTLLPVQSEWIPSCGVPFADITDCYPENQHISRDGCHKRGCCWTGDLSQDIQNASDQIKCIYPTNFGYVVNGSAELFYEGLELSLVRLPTPPRFGDDIRNLKLRVEMQTPYRLRIQFYDPEQSRFEVPYPKVPLEDIFKYRHGFRPRLYSVTYSSQSSPFSLKVRRSNKDVTIFDTSLGGLVFAQQFLQLTIRLPSGNLYGIGEQVRQHYLHDLQWSTWTLFSRPYGAQNNGSPGVHPFLLCVENDGNASGILLLNSNAMEIQEQPNNAITFRTIGGNLDFYLFLGPSPEDVVKQYTEAIGRPVLPPFWALGFQLVENCDSELVPQYFQKRKTKNINQDITDMNIGCSFWTNLQDPETRMLILSIEPTMKWDTPGNYYNGMDVFVNNTWATFPLVSKVDFHDVVFPAFGNSLTSEWWERRMKDLMKTVKFVGIHLKRNEPSADIDGSVNGCTEDNLNKPPYFPKLLRSDLTTKTLCMDAKQRMDFKEQRHYNLHNMYGLFMTMATERATSFREKRWLLLSHSTFVGSGRYSGHFSDNFGSTWSEMARSITSIFEFGLFGIPLVGVNICGNAVNVEEELCLRWIQLGAFYPLSIIHNEKVSVLLEANEKFFRSFNAVVKLRHELLPYLYTLFYFAKVHGKTVFRPLLHEFNTDSSTFSIDRQFLWGSGILITPVLEKGKTQVSGYFAKGVWYDYYTGEQILSKGEWKNLDAPLFTDTKPMNIHIRGGHIIVLHSSPGTSIFSRKEPMKLLVALNATQAAAASLYWDDGETKGSSTEKEYILINVTAFQNRLIVHEHLGKRVFNSDFDQTIINEVKIMGLSQKPEFITIDSSYILTGRQQKWSSLHKVLTLHGIIIPLARTTVIEWF